MNKAIVNVFASHNNIILLATDITGSETIARISGGMITKAQHKEGSPYTAMKAAEQIVGVLRGKGISSIVIKVRAPGGIKAKNPGPGAEAAITSLTRGGLQILEIENVTPMPHDSCRRKKKYRSKEKR